MKKQKKQRLLSHCKGTMWAAEASLHCCASSRPYGILQLVCSPILFHFSSGHPDGIEMSWPSDKSCQKGSDCLLRLAKLHQLLILKGVSCHLQIRWSVPLMLLGVLCLLTDLWTLTWFLKKERLSKWSLCFIEMFLEHLKATVFQ